MKRLILMSLIASLLVLAVPGQAQAKKNAKSKKSKTTISKSIKKSTKKSTKRSVSKKSNANNPRVNLSTDVRFDADTVYGKYQYSDEAMATVEDEKLLTNLLGVRKDFNDRLQIATKKR